MAIRYAQLFNVLLWTLPFCSCLFFSPYTFRFDSLCHAIRPIHMACCFTSSFVRPFFCWLPFQLGSSMAKIAAHYKTEKNEQNKIFVVEKHHRPKILYIHISSARTFDMNEIVHTLLLWLFKHKNHNASNVYRLLLCCVLVVMIVSALIARVRASISLWMLNSKSYCENNSKQIAVFFSCAFVEKEIRLPRLLNTGQGCNTNPICLVNVELIVRFLLHEKIQCLSIHSAARLFPLQNNNCSLANRLFVALCWIKIVLEFRFSSSRSACRWWFDCMAGKWPTISHQSAVMLNVYVCVCVCAKCMLDRKRNTATAHTYTHADYLFEERSTSRRVRLVRYLFLAFLPFHWFAFDFYLPLRHRFRVGCL